LFSKAPQETKVMKRVGHIYEQIVSVENCRQAIYNAAQGKGRRKEVKHILNFVNEYAQDLSVRLQNLDFLTPYRYKTISDGLSGKERELQIPSFYPDQCAHHAIVQVLKPIVEKSSYYWSCANMPKRGIDRACIGVERATRKDPAHAKYCVKLDITKFYPSIPHDKLKARLREVIKDEKALAIMYCVIDSHKPGIPIGNFTSPWFAELYLQPVDYFIKQTMKVKYYIRYADDMVLIDGNKKKLRNAMYKVIEFVKSLGVHIKQNYQLFRVYKNGRGRKIDFVGRCFGIGVTTIRKRRALALMRQSRVIMKLQAKKQPVPYKVAAGFMSRSACFKHTDSYGMKKKYYEPINIRKVKEVISNESKRKYLSRCA